MVKVDPKCGKLSYGLYAAQGQSAAVHLLPVFSYAGYMGGGVALQGDGEEDTQAHLG